MDKRTHLTGIIKARYTNLQGRDWINKIDPEDKNALLEQVRAMGCYGVMGGIARAAGATRDWRGRFVKDIK